MNDQMRKITAELRAKPSGEAADWLLQHYPGAEAIALLEHLSLRKDDNRRLASHYLAGPTHANDRAYRVFARQLGLSELVRILGDNEERNGRDAELLAYHLSPLLFEARDAEEQRTVGEFVESLGSS